MALDLNLSESEEMLKKTALDFIRRETPHDVLKKLLETDTGITDSLWAKTVEMGWPGILVPESYGGIGSTLTSAGVLFEALGSAPLPGPHFSSGILGSLIVEAAGSEEQKKSLLAAISEGQVIATLALTEPDYSWEPGPLRATATAGSGDFVLDGTKLFVMDAQAATHLIVVARTREEADPARGLSLFMVDKKTPGVSLRQVPGFLTGRSFEVKLQAVKVPRSALLGEADGGWPLLQEAIAKAIPVLCAYKVGACQALCELAVEYSRVRVQFGMPIGRFQRVQDMIIQMVTHTDAARWITYETLWKLDTGLPAQESVHLAKAVASEAYWQVVTLAHQVFSGISYSREHTVSFHTRGSRSLYNFLGEPAHHRQKLGKLLTRN